MRQGNSPGRRTRAGSAKEALQREKEQFRLLVECAPYAMVVIADDGSFEFVNRKFTDFFGYELPEVPNQETWRQLAYPDPAYRALVAQAWSTDRTTNPGGQVVARTFVVRCKDGSDKTVALYSTEMASGKRLMTAEDVTARHRLQEELLQAQKMEAVGRLAGGVAHDFNNLLQAMLSQAQLLREDCEDPGHVRLAMDEFVQQIQRGAALTRQLLLFSRREAARVEPVDLNVVVRGAVRLFQRLVRENITVTADLDREPLVIDADARQLEQVLVNLVVNSADAMPEGGSLTVRTRRVDGDWVALTVVDTGHGIPEEIRGRIFDPFFTTKQEGKGTGLGLSVVEGIIEAHGGTVEFETRTGEGTTFRILLPSARSEGGAAPAPAPELAGIPRGRGERVLLVEDEDGARAGLRDILTSLEYQTVAAATGAEAARHASKGRFHVLLTDLMLPDFSGLKLAQRLLDQSPDLSVILMSGYAEDEEIRRGVSSRQLRFLQKPFDIATLARELRMALDAR